VIKRRRADLYRTLRGWLLRRDGHLYPPFIPSASMPKTVIRALPFPA
jgi:hypothetical protein